MITYPAVLLFQQYLNTFLQNKNALNFLWNNQIHSLSEADFLEQYRSSFDPKMPVAFFANHTVQDISPDMNNTIFWHKLTITTDLKKRQSYKILENIEKIAVELQSVPRGILPFVLPETLPSDVRQHTFHLSVFKVMAMEIKPKESASATADLRANFSLEAVIEVE